MINNLLGAVSWTTLLNFLIEDPPNGGLEFVVAQVPSDTGIGG